MLLVLAGAQLPGRIAITQSASVYHRVFFVSKLTGKIERNQYVIFSLQHPLVNEGKIESITKKVACIEGDELKITIDKDFYCNDVFLGKAKDFSLKGEKLVFFMFNGIIPQDKMFVMGEHKDSFDSRYWGLLDVKDVKYTAWPIY